jgi:hypothetical protein
MPERTFRIKNHLPYPIYLASALLPNAFVFGGDYAEPSEDAGEAAEHLLPQAINVGRLTAGIAVSVIDESLPFHGIEELDKLSDEMELWSSYLTPTDDEADSPKVDKVYRMQPNGWFTVVLRDADLPGWSGGSDLEDFTGGTFDADMNVALDTVFERGRPPTLLIVSAGPNSQN